jgi:hypothetical protein
MNCEGQRFGHNFPYAGAQCLQCGISQDELSAVPPARPQIQPRPKRVQETFLKETAEKMFEYYGGKESFGLFSGMIKRKGIEWGRTQLMLMMEYPRKNNGKKRPIQFFMLDAKKS